MEQDIWHVEKPTGEGPETHPHHSWYRVAAKDTSTVAYVVGLYEANEMVENHNHNQRHKRARS